MDCSLPGSSIHGIFQARALEWVAISFSRRSSQPRDWTQVSHIVGRRFTVWATREVQSHRMALEIVGYKCLYQFCFLGFFGFISPHHEAYGILASQSGIEPIPPALGGWNLNHWTPREVPVFVVLWFYFLTSNLNVSEILEPCLFYGVASHMADRPMVNIQDKKWPELK